MYTISFIGSDKNAGKTTALNFVLKNLTDKNSHKICVTSIGINGENLDQYDGHTKPSVTINAGHSFLTTITHLKKNAGLYKILKTFSPPHFKNNYILGEATTSMPLVLEGPNEKTETLGIKQILSNEFNFDFLLIDGSIDRQFLANPQISDEFHFALLKSDRPEQLFKARELIRPLSFKSSSKENKEFINTNWCENTKSILWNDAGELLYHGHKIPFMDNQLKEKIHDNMNSPIYLYLAGALSQGLYKELASLKKLEIILDNFTLFQNIQLKQQIQFHPQITILNTIKVGKIFLKDDSSIKSNKCALDLPAGIPVFNIFREDLDAFGI